LLRLLVAGCKLAGRRSFVGRGAGQITYSGGACRR
jgi:hypothetical protein